MLDDLKISLLSGSLDSSTVARLRDAAADLKMTSGDPGLDAVLSEIELRVEVELAKAVRSETAIRRSEIAQNRCHCGLTPVFARSFCAIAGCAGDQHGARCDVVCHGAALYKLRRSRTISGRLAKTDGLALEKLKNYRPSDKEPFMNERQRDYFRAKLLAWKDEILKESKMTLQTLQEENVNHPDLADRASSETDRAIELRSRDRQRKLISKIDAALQRIEDNTYGYCEETGEPISLKRLEARPIATLSVEAQERHEKREKVYRDE